MKAKSGFTLVEILIVVVILGILAAIVIPQFTEASTEAKTSSLCTDLQTVRSQIELYKIQHNDDLPTPEAGGATWNKMTMYTDIAGTTNATYTAAQFKYGPYLQKIPMNQFNDDDTIRIEAGVSTAGAGTEGWVFNTDNGNFQADDSAAHAAL
jgi:general secretion pathway protein G